MCHPSASAFGFCFRYDDATKVVIILETSKFLMIFLRNYAKNALSIP